MAEAQELNIQMLSIWLIFYSDEAFLPFIPGTLSWAPPTRKNGHQSWIDFVMVRRKSSDSITKKPLYLDHLPARFGHIKDHTPLLFNIPYKWRAWKKPEHGLSKPQQALLQKHWELQSPDWSHWCQQLGSQLHSLRGHPPDWTFSTRPSWRLVNPSVHLTHHTDPSLPTTGPARPPSTAYTFLRLLFLTPIPRGCNSFLVTGSR